jgi:hypothetical protein
MDSFVLDFTRYGFFEQEQQKVPKKVHFGAAERPKKIPKQINIESAKTIIRKYEALLVN